MLRWQAMVRGWLSCTFGDSTAEARPLLSLESAYPTHVPHTLWALLIRPPKPTRSDLRSRFSYETCYSIQIP